MSIIVPIPTTSPTDPIFDVQAPLDGVTYTLHFEWNDRVGAWFHMVLDADAQVVLLGSQKVVSDYPLGLNSSNRPFPGYLIARDTSGQGADPGFDDLGARVIIDYFTAADVDLYAGSNATSLEVVHVLRLILGH